MSNSEIADELKRGLRSANIYRSDDYRKVVAEAANRVGLLSDCWSTAPVDPDASLIACSGIREME